ncbi:hypothetical protein CJ030_MR7G000049 [Morella rubra]|uniref:Uncharacterized protein n=1 Tax=Morella rubra TaxID=262757 RepID=A0A6A1V1I5_9ROSI|nr:hypothetical protein CJ030_MR7G000049 [Morella rubra]
MESSSRIPPSHSHVPQFESLEASFGEIKEEQKKLGQQLENLSLDMKTGFDDIKQLFAAHDERSIFLTRMCGCLSTKSIIASIGPARTYSLIFNVYIMNGSKEVLVKILIRLPKSRFRIFGRQHWRYGLRLDRKLQSMTLEEIPTLATWYQGENAFGMGYYGDKQQ